jgi:hypothetical protein
MKSPCIWTPQLSEPINYIYYLSQFELGFLLLIEITLISVFWLSLFGKGDKCMFGDVKCIFNRLNGSIFSKR